MRQILKIKGEIYKVRHVNKIHRETAIRIQTGPKEMLAKKCLL